MVDARLAPYLHVHPEVEEALAAGRPVVALESTIISHGMVYPQNVDTARAVEGIIRERGAVPATVAILHGRICVGIDDEQLLLLGTSKDVQKTSRRDMPLVVARGGHGATTVSATMVAAALAGIRVFVTGGIGGVHRGAPETFDISADLTELARTSVAVVCAGAKAILDLPLTLEWLETHGVPVLGFGTDEFPAFYSRRSGLGVDERVDTAEQVARIMRAKWDLGLAGGIVVGNPVPAKDEISSEAIESLIGVALEGARRKGVRGKALTPFLLRWLYESSEGRSLETNIALVRSNARVGAEIACAYHALALPGGVR